MVKFHYPDLTQYEYVPFYGGWSLLNKVSLVFLKISYYIRTYTVPTRSGCAAISITYTTKVTT